MSEHLVNSGPKRRPTHPGAILREDVLSARALSVSEFARRIGVSRQVVHRILAGTHGITPEMALRIGEFLGNGPELWLRMQQDYDLWQARGAMKPTLERIRRNRTA
jgi:addiction module HigA family antidote